MRKGLKHSEETRRKLSASHIGNKSHLGFKHSAEARAKISAAQRGRRRGPMSDATRRNISKALRGHHRPASYVPWNKGKTGVYSREAREQMSRSALGKRLSASTRRKIAAGLSGSRSHLWRGGITLENRRLRDTVEMRLWREAVFARDDWTCRLCGQRGGQLEADHIRQFAYYPDLRFEVSNGRTLCRSCHLKTETFGRKLDL